MMSRRTYIFAGMRQAGTMLLVLLIATPLSVLVLQNVLPRFDSSQTWVSIVGILGTVTTVCASSLLIGPVPSFLTLFDITDKQILAWFCILIIPYWAILGTAVGWFSYWLAGRNRNDESGLPIQVKRAIRWQVQVLAAAIALLSYSSGPIGGGNWVSKGPGLKNRALNNLRQIDSAKQQFGLEKKVATDYVPTEADILPYLKDGKLPRLGDERYVLGSMTELPFAVFDTDYRIRRRGWREGFTIPKGTEYHLPPD